MEQKEKKKMNKDMKIFIVFAIIIALGFLVFFYNMLKPQAIVTIEGNKVNTTEFQFYYSQNLSTALQSKDPSMDEETYLNSPYGEGTVKDSIKEQTLNQIVLIKLLLRKAKTDKFKFTGKDINGAWQAFEASLLENAASNNMTLQQFSKAAIGVSIGNVEKYYKEYVKSQRYKAAKTVDVAVDKAELTTFYNDNKAFIDRAVIRHILVTCAEDAQDELVAEKKKLAEDVLEKVDNGGDFAALAKEYSEDPGSKDNGGMYEIQPNGQMVPEFEDWTFSHKAGDTGIIRSSFGFHIMKLDSIYNTLESQRKEIEYAYKSNKYQRMLEESSSQYKIKVGDAYSTF